MMNGGQQIDPGLLQALHSISSSSEDSNNLAAQLKMAQQLRQPVPTGHTQMAGNVAIRNSPISAIGPAISNYAAQKKQNDVLQQMQTQAQQLRDVRGRYIDAVAAQQNPNQLHPDSQAQINGTPQPQMQAPQEPDQSAQGTM